MSMNRFDAVTRTFTERRMSRRATIAGGAASIAASGSASLGVAHATAQDSTPAAPFPGASDGDKTFYLFVQTFSSGTLQPHATEADTYTLSLTGAAAQTVYFSDRPERIVGTVPTAQFLENLGFTPDNPPNAALVAQTDAGEDIVVLELINPVYTEGFGPDGTVTLTYDVRILADYAEDGLAHLAAQQDDAMLPESFGTASLFIDDCADQTIACFRSTDNVEIGALGPVGFCWHFGDICCQPCASNDGSYWDAQCNQQFAGACGGNCASYQSDCWG